jgi:hypothetical protein
MLVLFYVILLIAGAAALLRWQGSRYEREHALMPQAVQKRVQRRR